MYKNINATLSNGTIFLIIKTDFFITCSIAGEFINQNNVFLVTFY